MSVLDAGCGSGYLYWSFHRRGSARGGILRPRLHRFSFIEIGRERLSGRTKAVLRIDCAWGPSKSRTQRFDGVVCINTLFCLPDYRQGLENLAAAARRSVPAVLRTTLDVGNRSIRYETDDYLDEGCFADRAG